jgi:hypothetical protein
MRPNFLSTSKASSSERNSRYLNWVTIICSSFLKMQPLFSPLFHLILLHTMQMERPKLWIFHSLREQWFSLISRIRYDMSSSSTASSSPTDSQRIVLSAKIYYYGIYPHKNFRTHSLPHPFDCLLNYVFLDYWLEWWIWKLLIIVNLNSSMVLTIPEMHKHL